jgi:hypothetical protein
LRKKPADHSAIARVFSVLRISSSKTLRKRAIPPKEQHPQNIVALKPGNPSI